MNNIFLKYKDKLKNPKALIILGIAGIVLIFLSSLGSQNEQSQNPDTLFTEFSVEDYRLKLTEDVEKIVKQITGNSDVTVVITLESGMRYKYADVTEGSSADKTENDTVSSSSESKQDYITVKTSDGGEQALLVTAQMPEIRGVAIVCVGGDNELIAEKIENTVTAALNITSHRVSIAGGN